MIAAEYSMPVLAAATGKPSHTALIWRVTISASTAWTPVTSFGFCAVTQSDRGRPENIERRKGLEVRLNARAAAAVRSGNRQRHRELWSFRHAPNLLSGPTPCPSVVALNCQRSGAAGCVCAGPGVTCGRTGR